MSIKTNDLFLLSHDVYEKTRLIITVRKSGQDKNGGEALAQLGSGCALKCAAIGMNDERPRVVYAKPSELS